MTFTDDRGEITEISEMDFKALLMIFSKKGAIRANHYHKTGGHLVYIISGKMRYVEEGAEAIMGPRESVFTGPDIPHAMEFLEDTLMVCASTVNRADGAYEDDLVRVKLI